MNQAAGLGFIDGAVNGNQDDTAADTADAGGLGGLLILVLFVVDQVILLGILHQQCFHLDAAVVEVHVEIQLIKGILGIAADQIHHLAAQILYTHLEGFGQLQLGKGNFRSGGTDNIIGGQITDVAVHENIVQIQVFTIHRQYQSVRNSDFNGGELVIGDGSCKGILDLLCGFG